MRLVIDTNVLVSGMLSSSGPPGIILDAARVRRIRPVVSAPILAEYRSVLRRPRLRIDPAESSQLLATLDEYALHVEPATVDPAEFPDPDDIPFYAAALAARCPLITGNLRHYPGTGPVPVLTPRQALALITGTAPTADPRQ